MAKLVRWLGAFRHSADSLIQAVEFELSHRREVACEPLRCGRTALKAGIGLVVDPRASRFVHGWLTDAWTEIQDDGVTLRPASHPRDRAGRPYRDWDRFAAAVANKPRNASHAEAVIDYPQFTAVAVRAGVSRATVAMAQVLADRLDLPLETVEIV